MCNRTGKNIWAFSSAGYDLRPGDKEEWHDDITENLAELMFTTTNSYPIAMRGGQW